MKALALIGFVTLGFVSCGGGGSNGGSNNINGNYDFSGRYLANYDKVSDVCNLFDTSFDTVPYTVRQNGNSVTVDNELNGAILTGTLTSNNSFSASEQRVFQCSDLTQGVQVRDAVFVARDDDSSNADLKITVTCDGVSCQSTFRGVAVRR